jgi:hypothetical protein
VSGIVLLSIAGYLAALAYTSVGVKLLYKSLGMMMDSIRGGGLPSQVGNARVVPEYEDASSGYVLWKVVLMREPADAGRFCRPSFGGISIQAMDSHNTRIIT